MHTVSRGPEPPGLGSIRKKYTAGWVDYYRKNQGTKPSDSRWRDFHDVLSDAFLGLCGYCEESDKGEVDHFRPKSRDPERVYEWSNWIFACHSCNNAKGNKWPPSGFIDPCTSSTAGRPENYFTFDTETGEILPRAGLSSGRRTKAVRMIDDLRLNASHHLKPRQRWAVIIRRALSAMGPDDPHYENFVEEVASRETQMSSFIRVVLAAEEVAGETSPEGGDGPRT